MVLARVQKKTPVEKYDSKEFDQLIKTHEKKTPLPYLAMAGALFGGGYALWQIISLGAVSAGLAATGIGAVALVIALAVVGAFMYSAAAVSSAKEEKDQILALKKKTIEMQTFSKKDNEKAAKTAVKLKATQAALNKTWI